MAGTINTSNLTFGNFQSFDDSPSSPTRNMLKHHIDFEETGKSRNGQLPSFSQVVRQISFGPKVESSKKVKTQEPDLSENPFEQELSFLFKNADYKWQSANRIKRFPLKKDKLCDVCRLVDQKISIHKLAVTKYLEPECNHEIHQICRSRFSRSLWDIGGFQDGYDMIKNCPLCYYQGRHKYCLLSKQQKEKAIKKNDMREGFSKR